MREENGFLIIFHILLKMPSLCLEIILKLVSLRILDSVWMLSLANLTFDSSSITSSLYKELLRSFILPIKIYSISLHLFRGASKVTYLSVNSNLDMLYSILNFETLS